MSELHTAKNQPTYILTYEAVESGADVDRGWYHLGWRHPRLTPEDQAVMLADNRFDPEDYDEGETPPPWVRTEDPAHDWAVVRWAMDAIESLGSTEPSALRPTLDDRPWWTTTESYEQGRGFFGLGECLYLSIHLEGLTSAQWRLLMFAMYGPPKHVTFWTWWDDRWTGVHLALCGSPVRLSRHGETDEGWSSACEEYAYTMTEDDSAIVTCSAYTDGRDCDGRMSTEWHGYCRHADLASVRPIASLRDGGMPTPKWTELNSGQRDYTAEAEGY